MKRYPWVTVVAATVVGACAAPVARQPSAASGVAAEIRDSGGRVVARARVAELGDSLQVRVQAVGLVAGSYAAHVHATGRCDMPAFESAGPHWNPTNRRHGRDNPAGQHLGDLPNLVVGTNGGGELDFTIPRAALRSGQIRMLDADGAALVIHASPDDYRTDPSGSSGGRIACGVLR